MHASVDLAESALAELLQDNKPCGVDPTILGPKSRGKGKEESPHNVSCRNNPHCMHKYKLGIRLYFSISHEVRGICHAYLM